MTADEVREKYLEFFKTKPRNHKEISPAPLVLENDPTTLFTSSGMQPLVSYLMGESHPSGSKRLVNSQPSIRTVDIDEVGDNCHLTFFEMLGNWSLGDYFKKEQLSWIDEFFTKKLGLSHKKLWVSVFAGNKQVAKDTESAEIWKSLGIPENRICYYGVEKNWWSRTGTPDQMPVGEIGGPDSEIFYDFGEELKLHERSEFKSQKCHPNCTCGRFLEIGNSVFIQYKKVGENKLEELPNKNVDFGGGLERITAAVNDNPDVFKIDVIYPIIQKIEQVSHKSYLSNERAMRIITDHIRASCFLIMEGVVPFKEGHGSVLRRLIRGSVNAIRSLGIDRTIISTFAQEVVKLYKDIYPKIRESSDKVMRVLTEEEKLYTDTVLSIKVLGEVRLKESSLAQAESYPGTVTASGINAFYTHTTQGVPPDISLGYAREIGTVRTPQDEKEWWKVLKEEEEKHRQVSRAGMTKKFKGGLADHSHEVIRLHTATHLLLASLRKVLGEHVIQKGQNITKERSRFDFPNPEKLSDAQIKEVEEMINDIVERNLPVNFKIMSKGEAEKTGAMHVFNEKYADTVKVYYVGKILKEAVSREFCGGPHVSSTGEIGHVKIKKQEKIGAGLVRLYAKIVL